MQISTNAYFRSQTENIQDLKTQTIKLQETISTGKQVNIASDDPVAFSDLAMLKARGSRLQQYGRNIDVARQRLSLEESSLSQATNILTRLHELSIQGSNDTLNASDRKLMANEVKGLSKSLMGLANTLDANGLPIFGGFQSGLPFQQSTTDGPVFYKGDAYEVEQAVGDHERVTVGFSGHEVFDRVPMGSGPSKSVFDIVKSMGDALANGDSPSTGKDEINAALDHITGQLALVGSRTAILDSAQEKLDSAKTATTAQISLLEDTDMEKAISELKQKLTTLDAAQASFVKIAELSLFNYLK
jgi:flagellar hook-associated protein 3 FlgL